MSKGSDYNIQSRITLYSTAALAMLCVPDRISAEVHDTELGPDTFHTNGTFYMMDINGDFVNDFKIRLFQNTNFSYTVRSIVIEPLLSNGSIAAMNSTFTIPWSSTTKSIYIPSVLSLSSYIDRNMNWKDTELILGKMYTNSGGNINFGAWRGADSKYIGLRIHDGADTLYGYARLSVSDSADTFVVHQYGWDDTPSQGIAAGAEGSEPADKAHDVYIADNGDSGNGADLWVKFDKANDESTLSEYRIMVVPRHQSSSFDEIAADTVNSANYTSVDTAGKISYAQNLDSNATDINGDSIQNNVPYLVYIQSVADGQIAGRNTLSIPSNEVSLRTAAEAVSIIQVQDIDNQSNGKDLLVNFPKVDNEQFIAVYRVIVAKAAKAGNYTLLNANAEVDYTPITPIDSNISTVLPKIAKDSDGDLITNGVAYKVLVLSVADGSLADLNALSQPSLQITLTSSVDVEEVKNDLKVFGANGKLVCETEIPGRLDLYTTDGRLSQSIEIQDNTTFISSDDRGILIYRFLDKEHRLLRSGKIFLSYQ